uniref:Putative ovule protein n=1 Tax=Solanum chacoense TaxID=4108 RepID=A0A0V0IF40_SOLCH
MPFLSQPFSESKTSKVQLFENKKNTGNWSRDTQIYNNYTLSVYCCILLPLGLSPLITILLEHRTGENWA